MLENSGMKLCLLATALVLTAAAQDLSKRHVDVTVTDPLGRYVTGLDRAGFDVIENGVRRAITDFSDPASPVSIAVVSEEPLSGLGVELIQAASVSDALRQLEASSNSRKAIVTFSAAAPQAIPSSIQTVQTDQAGLAKAVIGLRNQYRLEYESSTESARVEVVLRQPVGMPHLELRWK
jgi:hypothetical protein